MTQPDEFAALRAALADCLEMAEANAAELRSALGHHLPHKHKAALADIELQKRGAEEFARLLAELDSAKRAEQVHRAERDQARAGVDYAVRLLTGINALLYPAPIKTADGRTMVFRPNDPDPHDVLQELSDRIRALPDELAAMKAKP